MKNVVLLVLISLVVFSCNTDEHIKENSFEGIIFNNSTSLADPIDISPEEVKQFERTLTGTLPAISKNQLSQLEVCVACSLNNIRTMEKHVFVLENLEKYKRQYYGFTENGRRGIQVYGLLSEKMKNPEAWKKPFEVIHKGEGEKYWWLGYDIEKDSILHFYINSDSI